MELLPHIKILLRDHDRAFIPGLGGFVKERVPARIGNGHIFHPPGCTFHFNPKLTKEDGLLSERTAEEEGVRFDRAREMVRSKAREWERTLDEKGRLELDGVGLLFRDGQGKLRFEPDPDPELDPRNYGLERFIATPVEQGEKTAEGPRMNEEQHDQQVEEGSEGTVPQKKRVSQAAWWKAAAVAIPLLILGYGIGRYQKEGRLLSSWAEHIPGMKKVSSRYESRERTPSFTVPPYEREEEKNEDPPFVFQLDESSSYTVVKEKKAVEKEKLPRYLIVGGCFSNERNAQRRKEELARQGFSARVLDRKRKGLHVVIFSGSSQRGRALKELGKARREMPEAWLLQRSSF